MNTIKVRNTLLVTLHFFVLWGFALRANTTVNKENLESRTSPIAAVSKMKKSRGAATFAYCYSPERIRLANVSATSYTLEWETIGNANAYDLFVSASNTQSTGAMNPTHTTTEARLTVDRPENQVNVYVWIRSSCPDSYNERSNWAGPFPIHLPMTPVSLPYTEDFQQTPLVGFSNDRTNQWVIGGGAKSEADKALYISKDEGRSNDYTLYNDQVSHVYKDFTVPQQAENIAISFDWRSVGERDEDYLSVWLVPEDYVPTARTAINTNQAGVRQIGLRYYQENPQFKRETIIVPVAAQAGQVYRLVFQWKQDSGGGAQPAAAIDNLRIEQISCAPPMEFRASTINAASMKLEWIAQADQRYEIRIGTDEILANANTYTSTNNYLIVDQLQPATTYYIWARSLCGNENSIWIGPMAVQTRLVAKTLPYHEDFEGTPSFMFINDEVNKWFIGSAVHHGGSQSLYISKDGGVSNEYNPNLGRKQVSHVYQDLVIPADALQLSIDFDWRCAGEGSYDNFKMWLAPLSFTPEAGTNINERDRTMIRVGQAAYSNSANFKSEQLILDATSFAGQTMRLIIEWTQDTSSGQNPAAAIDNLQIRAINCLAPTGGRVSNIRMGAFDLSWSAAANTSNYEVFVTDDLSLRPDETTIPLATTSETTYSFENLNEVTKYHAWLRSSCSAGDKSNWIGPYFVETPLVSSIALPYTEDFESNPILGFTYAQPNQWKVGQAVNHGGQKSLYITKDQGVTNTYDYRQSQIIHAYKNIDIPQGVDMLAVSFDWRAQGERQYDYNINGYRPMDFLSVWIVPQSYVPQAGVALKNQPQALAVNTEALYQNNDFTSFSKNVDVSLFQGQTVRFVFEWQQDDGGGSQNPAAIDNLVIQPLLCSEPTAFQLDGLTAHTLAVSWQERANVQGYELYLATSSQAPTATTAPTHTTTAVNYTFENLTQATSYYIWVRSTCGTESSRWIGPLAAQTTLIPTDLPFTDDFETPQHYGISNDTINQWYIGNAVHNGGTKALYISNDGGQTHAYTNYMSQNVASHIFKDFTIPAGAMDMTLTFDWKGVGEREYDKLSVWWVPVTYTPQAGVKITAAASRGVQLGRENFSDSRAFTTEVINLDGQLYAGQTMRLVFEWINDQSGGSNPPAVIDNLKLSTTFCGAPTTLTISHVSDQGFQAQWEATATGYELFLSTAGATSPEDTATPTHQSTPTTYAFEGLTPGQTYWVWVRSACSDSNHSDWIGPQEITLPNTPVALPYVDDFESNPTFDFTTDRTNRWYIGQAAPVSGTHSLYISGDGGVTNTYDIISDQVVQAYKDIIIPAEAGELSIGFDWRCLGEANYDFFSVWLVPTTYAPTGGRAITRNVAGAIPVGREMYGQQTEFIRENSVVEVAAIQGQVYRLVFQWKQDNSGGYQPAAAIDNLSVAVVSCSPPRDFVAGEVTSSTIATTWTGSGASSYELYLSTTDEMPTAETAATHRSTNPNLVFTNLAEGTYYTLWVRSVCGRDKSFWVGPIVVQTQLNPATLPYTEDFEQNPTFGYRNDTHNKWIIGNAVNNGGTKALYISDDNGVSNQYLHTVPGRRQTSHVYKDFAIPATGMELMLNFDWRNMGEGSYDNFRVWFVSADYTPRAGVLVQSDNRRAVRLGREYYSGSQHFAPEQIIIPAQEYLGRTMRIIFEWNQDESTGNNPAAAIDNIEFFIKSCLPPTNVTIGEIRDNAFDLSWTGQNGQSRYDLVLSTDQTLVMNEATVPTHTTTETNYTFTDVEEGTMYYVWIRSACSNAEFSLWTGPFIVTTPLVSVTPLPYYEDFEGTHKIGVTHALPNQWVVGNAVNNGGQKALYISNDNGVHNQYTVNKAQIVHAYKNIHIPADVNQLEVSFDWRSNGEQQYDRRAGGNIGVDFVKVWLVPISYVPQANVAITAADQAIALEERGFFDSREFQRFQTRMDVAALAGQDMRMVFEWKQDNRNGEQPPAAIDNLWIKPFTCKDVADLEAVRISSTSNIEITWTPLGQEQQWEVYIVESNQPSPTPLTAGIRVTNTPRYVFRDAVEGAFYHVYVRAVCSDTDQGAWSPAVLFNLFNPPGCANIELEPIDLPKAEDGSYVICGDENVDLNLIANYYDIKETSDYTVEAIEYKPPFPFVGGDLIPLTKDDHWSEVIDLGFDFCFYGKSYNKVLIGTNGMITFSVRGHTENGLYAPDSSSGYLMDPNVQLPTNSANINTIPYVNSIFGVMQDLFPTNSPADYSVNYQVLGTFPCRALVFNIYHLGLFNKEKCPYDVNDIEGTTQTSQIVLYEGTNIIEVYIKNRPTCTNFNEGLGVVGIQNATGTAAVVPPNRNVGSWAAANEAWRFVPSGESIAHFSWLKDGEFLTDEQDIQVTIDQTVTYTGRITYMHCNGTEQIIDKAFHFIKEQHPITKPKNMYTCHREPGFVYTYDLAENDKQAIGQFKAEDFILTYFASEADLLANENPLPTIYSTTAVEPTEIFVKMEHKNTHCFTYTSFSLQVNKMLSATKVEAIIACQSYVLPELAAGEAYYTEAYGQGKRFESGDIFDQIGKHQLYVYAVQEECSTQSKFTIEILEYISAYVIEDQVMYCEVYTLPVLPVGNQYFTEPDGQGKALQPGEQIISNQVIYIYADSGKGKVACVDQSSFRVSYDECPLPKGFSPNGDGINDRLDLSKYGVTNLKIYNRSGIEVFAYNGMMYTDEFSGKDKRGNNLPSGTYYYVVVTHGKMRTGWIQINR